MRYLGPVAGFLMGLGAGLDNPTWGEAIVWLALLLAAAKAGELSNRIYLRKESD